MVSIEDMKNSVKLITEADSVYTVQTVLKNTDSIYIFGVLQEVVKIYPENGKVNTVAQAKLAEPNKQSGSFSFEMIKSIDSYTRAGMAVDIDDVRCLIEGTNHSITNGIHRVQVDL